MSLSAGDKLGPYEILVPLGKGGMGEVYRARDNRLDREVAIKVLPAAVAQDRERLARFEREAKVLASLNHPNIAQIYGLEESGDTRALAMELVPGATLSVPQPMESALHYARQIADALEAAHEKGITHRDLKPANIMITPEGVVKVLDFGLASVPSREGVGSEVSNSPTLTMAATQAGVIMGTAAYMSPEQAAGKAVDRRADIWSFGVVLYEMLVGRKLFAGETVSHTLADVLRAPIDLDKLPRETPRGIRDLLRRCLNRDPKKRLRDIGDARLAIEEALSGSEEGTAATVQSPARLVRILGAVAAVFAAALAGLAFVHFREKPPAAQVVRFQIPAPEYKGLYKLASSSGNGLSVSPDGRSLAFTALATNNHTSIWIRSLDALDVRLLPGTEDANGLFWSPDSRNLGFAAAGKLKRIEAAGGPAQTLCDLPGAFRGGAWAPDGTIVIGLAGRPLMRVSDTGGAPAPLATPGSVVPEISQSTHPSFLPDGRHFVYALGSSLSQGAIYLGSLDARPEPQSAKPLATVRFPNTAVYAASPDPSLGYVLFEREGSLMALPFDAGRLEVAGAPVPIAERILINLAGSYSASPTGVLAYRTGSTATPDTQLRWFDRQGKQAGQVGPPGPYNDVQLSPDGRQLLVDHLVNQVIDQLWSADPARGVFSRVNPGEIQDYAGQISPDGRVAFTYAIGGALGDIYVKPATGIGTPEPLVKSGAMKHPNHWSLDGRYLIYDEHSAQKQDLWIVPMTGDRKPVPFLVTPADETDANFSPDTKWVAYSSDESGRREVYVQGFVPDHVPAAGIGKWQISTAGGGKPRWRRDGKELYYIATDGKMMAVPVKSTATTFEPGIAAPLFETHTRGYNPYDVAADGRFLINTVTEDTAADSVPITVVLNWTAGLKK